MIRKQHSVEILVFFCLCAGLLSPLLYQPINATPSETLLINEIMYHPLENENTNEWIELFNPTQTSIDVTDWMIADEKETDTLLADTDHGDGTTVIPSGGYAII